MKHSIYLLVTRRRVTIEIFIVIKFHKTGCVFCSNNMYKGMCLFQSADSSSVVTMIASRLPWRGIFLQRSMIISWSKCMCAEAKGSVCHFYDLTRPNEADVQLWQVWKEPYLPIYQPFRKGRLVFPCLYYTGLSLRRMIPQWSFTPKRLIFAALFKDLID